MESLISLDNISFLLVFLEGIISFFSPCIIPLIPVYMSYLAGATDGVTSDGQLSYDRKKVFLHTVFFVLGISFSFFILGVSFTALGGFFNKNQLLFTRISGILIILLGLFQLGFLDFKFLNTNRRFNVNLNKRKVNPITALIMGFTFSFAWTPCVGPALSSVLILASGTSSAFAGNMLILLYSAGFIIPFLLLGLFTTQVLNFLKKNKKVIKYTVKVGGVILVLMGIMTFTGWMNNISGYLNSVSPNSTVSSQEDKSEGDTTKEQDQEATPEAPEEAEEESTPAIDFTLTDQYGNEHKLSDYKGKVVFLNFWATWCPPCRKEMPDIQALYEKYNKNSEDVVILGVASPKSAENPNTRETDKEGVLSFLEENDLSFPILFDNTGDVFYEYYVQSLPTTYLIDKEGNIHGYAPGMLTKDIMERVIQQTLEATE
ncbi:cytochrome c biogenesis protein CcdA [Alloiococcus sp. CFN-8]|uniref:redoxin domain-containing protein n=1 Tax=Alloiococcus sp. CFN-8 TaxID=3416081 RepID=UPI003CE98E89